MVQRFQNVKAFCRKRRLSDHYPIVLSTTNAKWGPTPFRSLDVWLQEPSFIHLFKKEWLQLTGLSLDAKLKAIKKPLKKWNREVFSHIDQKIAAYQLEMQKLDQKAQTTELQECEWLRRNAIQSQLWFWLVRKERYWKQLSRCKILQEGDRNTKYFHLVASMQRQKKVIEKLIVNGEELTDANDLKAARVGHFKRLYKTTSISKFDISSLGLNKITEQMCHEMEAPVTKQEIKEAMLSCDLTKAPRYDGFNLRCIRHVWGLIGEEFCTFIQQFFEKGYLPQRLNTTWVTLIPEKKDAVEVTDDRPISMVGSIYKAIAKVLSRRLRETLPHLVGEAQTAFIKGRHILDGALISSEVVGWLKKHKRSGVLLKLDFQKAYDIIEWDSLDVVLQEMGFGHKWRGWIKACLTTATISILFNGVPSKPFRMQRGIRQGDPLSPFLFVLMVEVLNKMFMRAVQVGMIKGVEVGYKKLHLSHL